MEEEKKKKARNSWWYRLIKVIYILSYVILLGIAIALCYEAAPSYNYKGIWEGSWGAFAGWSIFSILCVSIMMYLANSTFQYILFGESFKNPFRKVESLIEGNG